MFVCFRTRELNWNYFSFPIWPFAIKRQRKDAVSVSSCNSVNSAIIYNMEIIIKRSVIKNLLKAMSQFIKDTRISENKYQKVHNLQEKTGCRKYKVSVTPIPKSMTVNFPIHKVWKSKTFKTQWWMFLKTWLFPFLGYFLHPFRMIESNIILFVSLLSICISAWEKRIKMVYVYSFLRYLWSSNPEAWLDRIIIDS